MFSTVQRQHPGNRHAAFNQRADHGRRALTETALELVKTGKGELGRGLAGLPTAGTRAFNRPASALSLVGGAEFEHVAVRGLCAFSMPVRSAHLDHAPHGDFGGECVRVTPSQQELFSAALTQEGE